MKRLLIGSVGLLSAIVLLEPSAPAVADEDVARPKRERVAPRRAEPRRVEPRRAEPPRQAASNWSGGQLGGSNGASSVNNTFVEPGAYICPDSSATVGNSE